MRTLVKKLTIALLVVATLGSSARSASAKSNLNLGIPDESVGDAAVLVISLTAVGAAALIGTITWLIVSSWPDDVEADAADVAETADAAGVAAPMQVNAAAASPEESAAAKSARRVPTIAIR